MRKAEALGETLICDTRTRQVRVTGTSGIQAAASALTLLRHKGLITYPQFRAGLMYASLRVQLYGPVHARASTLFRVIAEHISTDMALAHAVEITDDERAEREEDRRLMYSRGDGRLRRMSGALRVRQWVRLVCLNDVVPVHREHLALTRRGLQELADVWRTDQW